MELKKSNDSTGHGHDARSIYERGASDGAWLGLYLSVMFALSVGSLYVGLLNIPVLAMGLLVPFLTYRFLRRTHVACHGLTTFSALWMQGIVMFGCGSLIFAAAAYIFMRWLHPGFILDTLRMGVEFYRNTPMEGGASMADMFQEIIDNRLIPSPMDIALMWLWLGTFTGSVLSMFVTLVVRIKRVPPASPTQTS